MRRSCTPTSTRSTRRSSSATTRACAGRPVIVGGGVVLAASYEAKAFGIRTAMGGAQARAALPVGGRRRAADVGLRGGEQGRVRGLRATRRRSSRGCRSTRRSSTSAVCGRVSGTPDRDRAGGSGATCANRSGSPITVGIARTKFLAKVASAVGKPDGLLAGAARARAGVPAPAARRAAVGCRAGDRREAARPRDRDGRRGRRAPRVACSVDARSRVGPPPARARTQPRPAAGAGAARGARSIGSQRALGRAPVAGPTSSTRRSSDSSTGSRARMRAAGRVGPHGRAPPALRRLHPRATRSHTLARPTAAHARRSSRRARALLADVEPVIERRGLTLVGVSRRQPRRRRHGAAGAAVRPPERRGARRRARRRARPLRIGGGHAARRCSAATRASPFRMLPD